MASKNIKGITVEIGGNVTPLEKALKSVDASTKNLKSELGQINRLLKFDPKNATLLKQKYDVLEEQIKQTSEKLRTLKEAEKQAQSQFERGEISQEQYRGLQREVEQTTQDLKRYKKQLGDVEKQIENVDKATDDLNDSTKEIGEQSDGAATQSGDNWATLSIGINSAMEIAQKCIEVFKAAWEVGSKIGSAIGGFLRSSVEDTIEWRKDISKLEQNAQTAGTTFNDVSKELSYFIALTDEEDSSVEALSNLLKTGFKGEGLTAAVENLSGAVIQFPDTLKIESLADSLQETLATGKATGQFGELLERLGENLDTFNAGLAACTTEAEKQQYAIDFLAKNGLADINEEYRKNNEDLIAYSESQTEYNNKMAEIGERMQPALTAFAELKATLLEALLPAVETLAPYIEQIAKWLADKLADPSVQEILEAIAEAMVEMLTALGDIIKKAWDSGKIQSFLSTLSEKLPIIVEKIGDLIGKLAGADGSSLLDAFLAVADLVGNVVQNINDYIDYMADFGQSIIDSFEPVIKTVQNVIEYMKKLFEWLGKVKDKLFKLDSGLLSILGGSGKNRHFAKGGIVTAPTQALIGEAGSEAVIPLARLSGIMAAAMEKVGGNVVNGGNTYVMNVYPQDMTAGQQQALFNKFNRFIGQANGRSTI